MNPTISRKALAVAFLFALSISPASSETKTLFFGTGGRESKGIYSATFNTGNGKFTRAKLAAEIGSPGFLAFHPCHTGIFRDQRIY